MTTEFPEGAGGAYSQPDLPQSTNARSFAFPPPEQENPVTGIPVTETVPPATPAPARARITAAQLEKWAALYGTERRQLRRWVKIGEALKDPCPLDDPRAMTAWWARCMKHRPPEKIITAAASAPPREGGDGPPASKNQKSEEGEAGEEFAEGFDIGESDVKEGEAVSQARQLVGATFAQLKKAAKGGDLSASQLWQSRWERAIETLRKQQRAESDWQKQMRQWISKAEVETDVAEALTMLRNMREQMEKRVTAELRGAHSDLDESLLAEIVGIIRTVREREEEVFRALPCLRDSPDVPESLAA